MKKYSPEDILVARENRVAIQKSIIEKNKQPLMVLRVNYPGLNKNNDLSDNIIQIAGGLLNDILLDKIVTNTLIYGAEGPVLFLSVQEEAGRLKRLAIDVEEKHILGRCLDIDVHTATGESVSRKALGYGPRPCYICKEDAHNCVRSMKHSEAEIIDFIRERYRMFTQSHNLKAK